jgi:hypothetical protein
VAKQQKVLGVQYTEDEAEEFRFRLHLALAERQGNRAAVVAALEHERVEHDAARPVLSVPGYQQPTSPPLRGYDAWPRWARVTVPIFTVVVLGVMMGVVTGGEAHSTFEAESPLSSLLPTRPPGPPTTTAPRRITTTKLAASRPRTTQPPASPPATAGRVRVRVRRPDGSVVIALSPPPPKGRGHSFRTKRPPPTTAPPSTSPPTTAPPVTDPPTTAPPVTDPPTTAPPVTDPPTTAPPVTDPPTTAPPVTDPPTTSPPPTDPPGSEAMVPGDLCSPLGATAVTADGAPVLCVLELNGLDIEFRWSLV